MPVCPICSKKSQLKWPGSTTSKKYFSITGYSIASSAKHHLPLFVCTSCHHAFTHPLPNETDLATFYKQAPTDKSFIQEELGRRHTAANIIKKIQSLAPNYHTLIDLGCGPGLFLSQAAKAGFSTHGIESSNWAYKYATEKLTLPNIHHGTLDIALTLPPQSFDVVTAFDLIEHLSNPKLLVKVAAHLLKPKGLLVITTPRLDSFSAKLFGKKWHALFPEHLHYFSHASLKHLLSSNNFTLAKNYSHTRHFSINYLLSRILRRPLSVSFFPFTQIIPINLGDEFETYAILQK